MAKNIFLALIITCFSVSVFAVHSTLPSLESDTHKLTHHTAFSIYPHTATQDTIPLALLLGFNSADQLFTPIEDVTTRLADDPEDSGNRVLQITGFAFDNKGGFLDLETPIDLTRANQISIRFYAPAPGIEVILFLKGGSAGVSDLGREAITTAVGWQELTFTFRKEIAVFSKIDLRIFYANADDLVTFFVDDIAQQMPTGSPAFPLDFESANQVFSPFSGNDVSYSQVPNPENPGNRVLQIVNAGKGTSEKGFLALNTPIDLSAKNEIAMQFYASSPGIPVRLGFENSFFNNIPGKIEVSTKTEGWQDLQFNFRGKIPDLFTRIVLTVGFENARPDTFLVDNIMQRIPTNPIRLPIDFENGVVRAIDFINTTGDITSSVISNPQRNGINTSEAVAEMKVKVATGFSNTRLILNIPIDFEDKTRLRMKVYAPKANVPLTLRLLPTVTSNRSKEVVVLTTKTKEWELVEFDFVDDIRTDYNQITFTWQNPTEDYTFLIDDIEVAQIVYGGATLSDLQVNGQSIAGFDPRILVYTVDVPSETTPVPTVTPTATEMDATVSIDTARSLSDITLVTVTSADRLSKNIYKITFKVVNLLGLADESVVTSYPNPATDILTLQLADRKVQGDYSLSVMDASGRNRKVNIEQEGNSIRVDVSPLASGLYFIRLQREKEEFISRFIKR